MAVVQQVNCRFGLDWLVLGEASPPRLSPHFRKPFISWLTPYVGELHGYETCDDQLVPARSEAAKEWVHRAMEEQRQSMLHLNQMFHRMSIPADGETSYLSGICESFSSPGVESAEIQNELYLKTLRCIDQLVEPNEKHLQLWLTRMAGNLFISMKRNQTRDRNRASVRIDQSHAESKKDDSWESQTRRTARRQPSPFERAIADEELTPFSDSDWQCIAGWAEKAPLTPVVILLGTGWFRKIMPLVENGSQEMDASGSSHDSDLDERRRASQRAAFEAWISELGFRITPMLDLWKAWNLADDAGARLDIMAKAVTDDRGRLIFKYNTLRSVYYRRFSGTHQTVRQASFGKVHLVVALEYYWQHIAPLIADNERPRIRCVRTSKPGFTFLDINRMKAAPS